MGTAVYHGGVCVGSQNLMSEVIVTKEELVGRKASAFGRIC